MLLFMIHNDEASYASFGCRHRRRLDSALSVPKMAFSPLTSSHIILVIVMREESEATSDFTTKIVIVEQDMKKKFDLISLSLVSPHYAVSLVVRHFFLSCKDFTPLLVFSQCLST